MNRAAFWNQHLTFRIRLIAAFLLMGGISAGIMAVYGFFHERHLIYASIERQYTAINQAGVLQIGRLLDEVREDMQIAALMPRTQDVIQSMAQPAKAPAYRQSVQRLGHIFSVMLKASGQYVQICLLDAAGMEVVRIDGDSTAPVIVPDKELQSKADRPYFRETCKLSAGHIYISDPALNQKQGKILATHRAVVHMGTPLFDHDNVLRGILVITIDTDFLLYRAFSDMPDAELPYFVSDMRGFYIHHCSDPDDEWGGPEDLGAGHSLRQDYPHAADVLLSGKSGVVESGPWKIFFAPIPLSADASRFLVLGHLVSRRDILKSANQFIGVFLGVMLLGFGLAIVSALWLSGLMTAPLNALRFGARQIAAGHLAQRIEALGSPEFLELAGDFNEMASRLEKSYNSLQAEYQHLFENANDAIVIHALDGRILDVNQTAVTSLGYTRDELLRNTVQNIMTQAEAILYAMIVGNIQEKGSAIIESVIQCKDGATIPVEISATMLKYQGQPAIQSFVRNIRERKQAEARLLKSNRELKTRNVISLAIGRYLDLTQLLDTVLKRIVQLLEMDMAGISLMEPGGDGLKLWVQSGFPPELLEAAAYLKVDQGLSGWVVSRRRPIIMKISEYPFQNVQPILRREGIQTIAGIPLISRETVVGAMLLACRTDRAFDAEELETMTTFGAQIAVAVENVRLYEQVLQEKRYAETVVQSISDGVYTVDRNNVILSWNKGAEFITGYAGQDVIGKPCSEILRHQDDSGQVLCNGEHCPLRIIWKSNGPVSVDGVFFRNPSGRLRPVSLSASPIMDSNGEVVGAVEIFRDISKEVELIHNIQLVSQAKSRFLANMSHELRTPMNAILGFSEVLSEEYFGPLNAKQKEYVADILSSGNHLLALINDVLDLSKVEAGKMELEAEPCPVMDIIEDSLLMIREKAVKHGITIHRDIPESMETRQIYADSRKLKQTLFNLLANAVKFTQDSGGITVRVRVSDPPGATLQIAVEDTGIGIHPDHLEKIFDAFYQVQGDKSRLTPGTGLGLSLARKFVQLHGGGLRAESEGPGKGSRFVIELPLNDHRNI